ncbi:MAG: thiosulfate oxidation carrier protein SoxY [Proteobacteria bacterium]|nr:thiosulfate oxidation carrier protein SoxY [Pseudomonadota bacterium]
MNELRRTFLRRCSTAGAVVWVVGMLKPIWALAAEWNKAAFEASSLADALKNSGTSAAVDSKELLLKVADHAENGAVVQIEVTSKIPATTSIAIYVEKNPRPLVADMSFQNGAEPYIFLVTKMAETSRIRAVARACGKTYFTAREVHITSSGC